MISFSCSSVQFCARKAEAAAARRWRAGGRRAATWRGTRTLARIKSSINKPYAVWISLLPPGRGQSSSEALALRFYTFSRPATAIHRLAAMRWVLGLFWHEWDFTTRSFAIEGSWCSFGRSKGNFCLFNEQPGSGTLSCGHSSTI